MVRYSRQNKAGLTPAFHIIFAYNTKILYTSYYLFFVPNNNLFIIGILFNISVIIGKRIIVPINNII